MWLFCRQRRLRLAWLTSADETTSTCLPGRTHSASCISLYHNHHEASLSNPNPHGVVAASRNLLLESSRDTCALGAHGPEDTVLKNTKHGGIEFSRAKAK